jgi:hypothetical protein
MVDNEVKVAPTITTTKPGRKYIAWIQEPPLLRVYWRGTEYTSQGLKS